MQRLSVLLVVALAFAGCSGKSGTGSTGEFELSVADSLAGGRLELQGAFLRSADGWAQALPNGTAFDFKGTGGNVSAAGKLPAGDYDRLRLVFQQVKSGASTAALTQSGVEVAVNVTVTKGGSTAVALAFAWADSFFQSASGLAFSPVLSRLVVTVDGAETIRLEASDIGTGSGRAPVARMRVFDPTGLEAFGSTFVADSPEDPVVGNAGNITLTGTQSEALHPGARLATYTWDISGASTATFKGATVRWDAPVSGGNHTIRLTVEDSEGNTDSQTVRLALKPGLATRTLNFTGTASGPAVGSANAHTFDVDNATFDGAPAQLTHVSVLLEPGAAAFPLSNLDLTLLDGAGEEVDTQDGQGSQHRIDEDVSGPAGTWTVEVTPNPAYEAAYKVTVVLTWKGVNPGIEAFLADYEDGHSHEH